MKFTRQQIYLIVTAVVVAIALYYNRPSFEYKTADGDAEAVPADTESSPAQAEIDVGEAELIEAALKADAIEDVAEAFSSKLVWLPDADIVWRGEGEGPLRRKRLGTTEKGVKIREVLGSILLHDGTLLDEEEGDIIGFKPIDNDEGWLYYAVAGTSLAEYSQYLIRATTESVGFYLSIDSLNKEVTTQIQMDSTLLMFIPIA